MKTKKWIIWLIAVAALLAILGGVYAYALSHLPVSYGEKGQLTSEQLTDEDYLAAWQECSQLTAACRDSWNGKWPDYYGGMGVVENEGSYLVNVYLTENTEANRQAVCEAAGAQLRAFTVTDVSWSELEATLKRVDTAKSLPFITVQGLGIDVERHTVRVYLSHRSMATTLVLGLVKGPVETVIIPVQPTVRSATREEDGTVTLSLGGLTYATAYDVEISTDAAFEEDVNTISFEGNDTEVFLPDPGEGEAWYVRAKSYLTVEETTYQSEWSSAKTVK